MNTITKPKLLILAFAMIVATFFIPFVDSLPRAMSIDIFATKIEVEQTESGDSANSSVARHSPYGQEKEHHTSHPQQRWLDVYTQEDYDSGDINNTDLVGTPRYIAPSFAGGTGTAIAPFEISTPAQLARMAWMVNTVDVYANNDVPGNEAHFVLTGSVNISQHLWVPVGRAFSNSNNNTTRRLFMGSLDGRGHTVHSMTIVEESFMGMNNIGNNAIGNNDSVTLGFFGQVGPYATVQNITFDDALIDLTISGSSNNVSTVPVGIVAARPTTNHTAVTGIPRAQRIFRNITVSNSTINHVTQESVNYDTIAIGAAFGEINMSGNNTNNPISVLADNITIKDVEIVSSQRGGIVNVGGVAGRSFIGTRLDVINSDIDVKIDVSTSIGLVNIGGVAYREGASLGSIRIVDTDVNIMATRRVLEGGNPATNFGGFLSRNQTDHRIEIIDSTATGSFVNYSTGTTHAFDAVGGNANHPDAGISIVGSAASIQGASSSMTHQDEHANINVVLPFVAINFDVAGMRLHADIPRVYSSVLLQWQAYTNQSWSNVSGATSASFLIPDNRAESYRLQVQFEVLGNQSTEAIESDMSILDDIKINFVNVIDGHVYLEHNYTTPLIVTAQVEGLQAVTYQWQRLAESEDEASIAESNGRQVQQVLPGLTDWENIDNTTHIIQLDNTSVGMFEYRLRISGTNSGIVYNNIIWGFGVTVVEPLTVDISIDEYTVVAGRRVVIAATAVTSAELVHDVQPFIDYQWMIYQEDEWVPINGAIYRNLILNTETPGTFRYRVIVRSSHHAIAWQLWSWDEEDDYIDVVVLPFYAPSATPRQTAPVDVRQDDVATIGVDVGSLSAGTALLQWQVWDPRVGAGWIDVPGEVRDTLTPNTSEMGRFYFRLVIVAVHNDIVLPVISDTIIVNVAGLPAGNPDTFNIWWYILAAVAGAIVTVLLYLIVRLIVWVIKKNTAKTVALNGGE